MKRNQLIGKEHQEVLNWLEKVWPEDGSTVCILEGFPGVGKTHLSRALMTRTRRTSVMITATETAMENMEDLLLELADELSIEGKDNLAQALRSGKNLRSALVQVLREPVLIIIDEFQKVLGKNEEQLPKDWSALFRNLANRPQSKGKILLLTNRMVEHTKWAEPFQTRKLKGLGEEDGEALFTQLLEESDRTEEIEPDRRRKVVRWLGGNPRAMRLLVSSLAHTPLEDLINIGSEAWAYEDRFASPELVQKFEERLLLQILDRLDEPLKEYLFDLCVLRKPFQQKAIEILVGEKEPADHFKKRTTDLFLMEQYRGWFTINPIVREVGLNKLYGQPTDLQKAHAVLARYYTRHFHGKRIVGSAGKLGAAFTEARFHLTQADREKGLSDVVYHFQDFIKSTISSFSPVPKDRHALNERIAVLSALLTEPGPKGLEYHLGRLYQVRMEPGDLDRGIIHARRALNKNSEHSWILAADLQEEAGQSEEAIDLLREGIGQVSSRNLVSLYQSCGELLSRVGRLEEALELLREGIERVPARHSGYRIAEQLALYELGRGNTEGLRALTSGSVLLSGKQLEQLKVLIAVDREDWEDGMRRAVEGRKRFPTYIVLAAYEAFCRLASEQPGPALAALESFPSEIAFEKESAHSWLMAFIQFELGNYEEAKKYLSAYLGTTFDGRPEMIHPELLQVWDTPSTSMQRNIVRYNFPVLPASLSGLDYSVRVLPTSQEVKLPEHLKTLSRKPLPGKTPEESPGTAAEIIRKKTANNEFDVFLCHNIKDKVFIKKIGEQLKSLGIRPWLDEWELVPGRPWTHALEAQIENIHSVAVFVGPDGVGPWQRSEIDAYLRKFHSLGTPVIPVILPACEEAPDIPVFLEGFQQVDFRKEEPNPYSQLVWGITGKKPEENLSGLAENLREKILNGELLLEIQALILKEDKKASG